MSRSLSKPVKPAQQPTLRRSTPSLTVTSHPHCSYVINESAGIELELDQELPSIIPDSLTESWYFLVHGSIPIPCGWVIPHCADTPDDLFSRPVRIWGFVVPHNPRGPETPEPLTELEILYDVPRLILSTTHSTKRGSRSFGLLSIRMIAAAFEAVII